MTVKQAIQELRKLEDNVDVYFRDQFGDIKPISSISMEKVKFSDGKLWATDVVVIIDEEIKIKS